MREKSAAADPKVEGSITVYPLRTKKGVIIIIIIMIMIMIILMIIIIMINDFHVQTLFRNTPSEMQG